MTEIINALHELMKVLSNENFPIFICIVLMGGMFHIGSKLAKSMDKLTSAITASCVKMDTIVEFIVKEGDDGQRRHIKPSVLAPSPIIQQ